MDIDIVYTWVNHEDPEWQIEYKKALFEERNIKPSHPSVKDIARFWNRNELFYSIKSVYKYAPWVRNIYIVTNCLLPEWTKKYKKIIKIDHQLIFKNKKSLPTFNSRAIEANLHRIPGVSEKFIYFNDDVFLCKSVKDEDFFSREGKSYIFQSKHDVPYKKNKGLRPIDYGILNACNLLIRDYRYKPLKKLHHAPFPILKSTMFEIEDKYIDILDKTASHKFRNNEDLPLATTMHAYYSLINGYGELKKIDARYIDIGDPLFIFLVNRFSPLRRGKYTTFCLNEISSMKYFNSIRDIIVEKFLIKMFED